MKKLILFSAICVVVACNSNSETKKTEDSTNVVDKMDHTTDTAGQNTNNADVVTGPTELSDMDRDFVMKVAMANTAEVQTGQLASSKGNSAAVKEYGDMMVRDHTDAQGKLRGMAGSMSLSAPDSVDAKHKALKDKLSKLSGDAFDKEYANAMVMDHKEAISLFEKQASGGTNGQLKQFATNTLPTLRAHLEAAQKLIK
jgi:putative membrane protein